MLVLSRKEGQRIFIGDDIELVIVYLKGNRVGIGIQCDAGLRILREEVAERDRQNAQEARS